MRFLTLFAASKGDNLTMNFYLAYDPITGEVFAEHKSLWDMRHIAKLAAEWIQSDVIVCYGSPALSVLRFDRLGMDYRL